MVVPQKPSIETLTSIQKDGSRYFLHPADVDGRFTQLRRKVFFCLIVILIALPFIRIQGYPAVWLDISHRSFHFFGTSLGPTDTYLLFFLLTGLGFFLIVLSALFGRVWCGYACPQTVFLEGVFRRIERLIEGTREAQIRLEKSPWNVEKIWKKTVKNILFIVCSAIIAHVLICYFVSPAEYWRLIQLGPQSDPSIFVWTVVVTGIVHFNFVWFREQLCIIICPYGRLQSALCDSDTIVVGYDKTRGEPRGHLKTINRGDCIDCHRCVVVCPTGIDIRQGMQLECVGCGNCIDACNEVMMRISQKEGLIRYDSDNGFNHQKKKFFRPRLYLYFILGMIGAIALSVSIFFQPQLPATLVRQKGAPFVVEDGIIRNAFIVHLHNKTHHQKKIYIELKTPIDDLNLIIPQKDFLMDPFEKKHVPFFLSFPLSMYKEKINFRIIIKNDIDEQTLLNGQFLGPS